MGANSSWGETGSYPPGVFRVSRNRIRQNIAVYAASAGPYSSEFGPEYLAFRAVNIPEHTQERG